MARRSAIAALLPLLGRRGALESGARITSQSRFGLTQSSRRDGCLSSWRRLATVSSAATPPAPPPNFPENTQSELEELRFLIEEVSEHNKADMKKLLLGEASPRIRELLKYIYHPKTRLHTSSKGFMKYVESGKHAQALPTSPPAASWEPTTLLGVLQELHNGTVSGNAALDLIASYAHRNKAFEETSGDSLSLLQVLCRVLDRNLRAGFSANTVDTVFSSNTKQPQQGAAKTDEKASPNPFDVPYKEPRFSVPLGFEVKPRDLSALFKNKTESDAPWFVSRKLDGVRCIFHITVVHQYDGKLRVSDIVPYSRSGKIFYTLDKLRQDLANCVQNSKQLYDYLLGQDPELIYLRYEEDEVTRPGRMHEIYLDGEACVLEQARDGDASAEFVENFHKIAGQLQRKNHTLPHPAYFPFDIATNDDFWNWRHWESLPFVDRVKHVGNFVDDCLANGSKCIRKLEQSPARSEDDIGRWTEIVAKNKWEGLILRDGASLYEGKRTKALRKVKKMTDAEYVVEDIETAEMRLALDGKFAQREALASIIIRHKGHPVNVGSGFTAEQRVRFAADPSLIIGKQVTVAYFEESFANSRPGQASLRFPAVKTVWEGGKRDI